jgi:hypothetical protein
MPFLADSRLRASLFIRLSRVLHEQVKRCDLAQVFIAALFIVPSRVLEIWHIFSVLFRLVAVNRVD